MAVRKTEKPVPATEAKFPYTNKPTSLRRILKDIPARPKPAKMNEALLKSWEFRDSNDRTILRVLKAVSLLSQSNEPTDAYVKFMDLATGPHVLGVEIKRLYAPIFTASHTPFKESPEKLKNLFNIHSGGNTLDMQIQTFKALCESASFDGASAPVPLGTGGSPNATAIPATPLGAVGQPIVNINLHIHLPENKTRRDYETMIEDIGHYIFGRTVGDRGE